MPKFSVGDYVRLIPSVGDRYPRVIGDYDVSKVVAIEDDTVRVVPALRRFKDWSQYDLEKSSESEFNREMFKRRKTLKKNKIFTAG